MDSITIEDVISSDDKNMRTSDRSSPKHEKKKKKKKKHFTADDDDDFFNLSKRKKRKSEKHIVNESLLVTEDNPIKVDVTKGSIHDLLLGSSDRSETAMITSPKSSIDSFSKHSETSRIDVLTDDDDDDEISIENVNDTDNSVRHSSRLRKSPTKRSQTANSKSHRGVTKTKSATINDKREKQFDDEDNEDDDMDEDEILKSIEQFQNDTLGNSYSFSDSEEKERLYILNVIPKIICERPSSFSTKGTKEFADIIKIILSYYRNNGELSREIKNEDVALFWIQGRREIKPFFKPKSLRISPPNSSELTYIKGEGYTAIDCLLIPREEAGNALEVYDELKTKYEKFIKDVKEVEDIPVEEILLGSEEKDGEEDVDDEEEMVGIEGLKEAIEIDDNEDDGYFKIALKGKDNKQLFVKVNADTRLSKVFEYFCQKHNLTNVDMNKVKMVFDDEILNMEDTVGDTELESDFEVQIYV